MEQQEQDLWQMVDVGGYAAYGTLFSFTLGSIKDKVESDDMNMQEQRDRIKNFYEKIFKRFQEIDLRLLDKRFPVDTIKELRDKVFPEMGKKYKELDSLLKYFISGSTHLKGRVISKIHECQELVKLMGELGVKFTRNDKYWEYRNTNPTRIYLDSP